MAVQLSLGTVAARTLATTTKTVPQTRESTPRWLLRVLPWEEVGGGTYRVNRRLMYRIGDGQVVFVHTGPDVRVVPETLRELPLLREFPDVAVLEALADRFERREFQAGEAVASLGAPSGQVFLIVHGKVTRTGIGEYGGPTRLSSLAGGQFFGDRSLAGTENPWEYTATATTSCVVLVLSRPAYEEVADQSAPLRTHVARAHADIERPQNKYGEAALDLASGHHGEPDLPGTYVAYEPHPREYQLHVAQTVLRVHSRVADLFNDPMNQVEEQLRLTAEALRERQEHEMINNPDIGLLHNVDHKQRIHTRAGPPTPDDLDELLSRRRSTRFVLAHPRAIAAFGRECTRRRVYPSTLTLDGRAVHAWRGVPMLPCNKIPVSVRGTTSILAMRTGQADQGVVGLHQTGIPDEFQPGMSVRRAGVSTRGIVSYVVSAYYSVAVLVPTALGVLENVELFREGQDGAAL